MSVDELTDGERARYARHLSLPEIGEAGQLRLRRGSVLVVGAGGLGSPVALYLAAAGVGRIGLIDGDRVDESNLQRQVIHDTASVGVSKVASAAARLRALNPLVRVDEYDFRLTDENVDEIFAQYDFVIDATDSLHIKYLVDDVCRRLGKPYSHGAIWRYEGQTMTVVPGSVTFRSLFPEIPDEEDEKPAGPFGALPGVIGCIQAAEALKYLAGVGQLLTDRLLRMNLLTMKFTEIRLR